jgi:hypothetical protein
MSLDVYLKEVGLVTLFEKNITHNLGTMAMEAGLYDYLWNPDELEIKHAIELVKPLTIGLELLKSDPERFHKFDPANGWGTYEGLIRFVEAYLEACKENPDAIIEVSK